MYHKLLYFIVGSKNKSEFLGLVFCQALNEREGWMRIEGRGDETSEGELDDGSGAEQED